MKNGHALHVYFGEGKGKTTASFGLALRALGQGRRVLVGQFLKTNTSGELTALRQLPNVAIVLGSPIEKLTIHMSESEKQTEAKRQRDNFGLLCEAILKARPELIVLDELLMVVHEGFLNAEEVLGCVDQWLAFSEVALTGRYVPAAILEASDYATEMVKRKHPYDSGVMARKGIEF